jgi:trans-2,3-dihydro-3-hydroxyanthranilate isomerase
LSAGPLKPGSSQSRPWYWLDVFTDRPLAGNGLAVVLEADGIEPGTMLAFAKEVGLSETTFVQTASDSDADYLNRIWTVSGEIPFAGHPSLGTAVAVALHSIGGGCESPASAEPGRSLRFRQQTGAGIQEVSADLVEGGWQASVHQGEAVFGETFGRERVARALGLQTDRMDPELSCQIVSTGLPALLAPVTDLGALAECSPDFGALRELDESPALNLYPFVYERGSRTVRARSFSADLSGVEDPATGSAAGPLVAFLQDCLDISRITVEQGVEMGRPSRIEARIDAGSPLVSGRVAVLASGEIRLP